MSNSLDLFKLVSFVLGTNLSLLFCFSYYSWSLCYFVVLDVCTCLHYTHCVYKSMNSICCPIWCIYFYFIASFNLYQIVCIHHIFLIFSPRNRLKGWLTLHFTFSKAMIKILLCVPLKPIFFPLCLAASYYMLFEGVSLDGWKADFYIHGTVKIASISMIKKIKYTWNRWFHEYSQKRLHRQEGLRELFYSNDAFHSISGNISFKPFTSIFVLAFFF